jgi:hypothetical protein
MRLLGLYSSLRDFEHCAAFALAGCEAECVLELPECEFAAALAERRAVGAGNPGFLV